MNAWRDMCRAGQRRSAEIASVELADVSADVDVESQVVARDQLDRVVAALRDASTQQRSLLLGHDELMEASRPLAAAERVMRMRMRRQLAQLVGRASAAIAAFWVQRLARSSELAANTACAGVVAISAAGGAVVAPALAASSPSRLPVLATARVVQTHPAADKSVRHRVVSAVVVRAVGQPRSTAHPRVRTVCNPAPVDDGGAASNNGAGMSSGGLYEDDGKGHQQPVVETPAVEASPDTQCVQVGG
jgi:hypothetical protein